MKNNNSFDEIWNKLKNSKKILMTLHDGPDGDSLGSCVAMKYFLERDLGADVTLISKDNLEKSLYSFDFVSEIEFGKYMGDFNLEEFDSIIFLDHGTLNYYGKVDFELPKGKVINMDHHESNDYFGDLNYVDPTRPSACSVLIDLFRHKNVLFDKELSTRLLLGVYTDSGELSFSEEALKDATFLIENGANYVEGIVNKIKFNVSLNSKKYFALLTNKFEIVNFENCKVGYCGVGEKELEELNLNLSELRGGIGYLQEIGGVDFLQISNPSS